jgi:hypothetical protein
MTAEGDCELRDYGEHGFEVQLLRDVEFIYGRRWPTRVHASAEAEDGKRVTCEREEY